MQPNDEDKIKGIVNEILESHDADGNKALEKEEARKFVA